MTEQPTTTAFEQALTELAKSRGHKDLEQLKDKLRAAGHEATANDLPRDPHAGFGEDLDAVLGLSVQEKLRISDAFAVTFLGVQGPARETDAERRKIFGHIIVELDYAACLEEEEYGGTMDSKRIRESLIPFCEREGGLKSDAEEWAEHKARHKQ